MAKKGRFTLFREKTRLESKCDLTVAVATAKKDAREKAAKGQIPAYIIVGPFAIGKPGKTFTRIGKFKGGRIYWKFAE
jgi:hypothetical protein